jgi:hypothetical protein
MKLENCSVSEAGSCFHLQVERGMSTESLSVRPPGPPSLRSGPGFLSSYTFLPEDESRIQLQNVVVSWFYNLDDGQFQINNFTYLNNLCLS